jgi:hypothetical protein
VVVVIVLVVVVVVVIQKEEGVEKNYPVNWHHPYFSSTVL